MESDAGTWAVVCHLTDLEIGRARGFDLAGTGRDQVFVVRVDSRLHAYVNSCPHWPTSPLPWKKDEYLDATRSVVVCHGHGARFRIRDGLCVAGPCVGAQLTALPVKLDSDRICIWVPGSLLKRPEN